MIGHKAASCPSSGKRAQRKHVTLAISSDTVPRLVRSRKREPGTVDRKDTDERDHQREEHEELTGFGKRKAAGSGHQRNKADEMRAEQDGRNRWHEGGGLF